MILSEYLVFGITDNYLLQNYFFVTLLKSVLPISHKFFTRPSKIFYGNNCPLYAGVIPLFLSTYGKLPVCIRHYYADRPTGQQT